MSRAWEGSAIVSAIIALAHSLEMDVVAEGVEAESQLDHCKSMMCDETHRFLLGKPVSLLKDRARCSRSGCHRGGATMVFEGRIYSTGQDAPPARAARLAPAPAAGLTFYDVR